jgi:TldD protein
MLIDPEFTSYPLRRLAEAALQRAAELGAQHADFRAERIRSQAIRLSDGSLETSYDADVLGLGVRVVVEGTWGFASAVDLTPDAAARAAAEAVDVARVAAAVNTERIELAGEPAYGDVIWVSDYQVDPFSVGVAEKIELLAGWSSGLLARDGVDHVDASLLQVKECKFYSDGATTATQQRVRLHPVVTAVAVEPGGRFETMHTLAPPVGRGYEFMAGAGGGGWDFESELAELPGLLAAKLADDSRVGRARYRARPGARLRGRLRGDLLCHPGPARPAAVRLAADACDRGPHHRARPGHDRLRR